MGLWFLVCALIGSAPLQSIPQPPSRNSFPFSIAPGNRYVGHKVCVTCHPGEAKEHEASHHAHTWKPVAASRFAKAVALSAAEGPNPAVAHRVAGTGGRLEYRVELPDGGPTTLPVHSVLGGKRFGWSFILEAREIGGLELSQPALVEGRYMFRTNTGALSISPGLPAEKPTSFDTALGRVLAPAFAARCFDCHGGVVNRSPGSPLEHPIYKDTAVRCERCHGPGKLHVDAVARGSKALEILDPRKLSTADLLRLCGQCHGGFAPVANPRPQDVLISAQTVALSNSRCYLESRDGVSCLQCHNPHRNATRADPAYIRTCLSCHAAAKDAPPCPVNSKDGCIGCHMRTVERPGSFELTDHWIRAGEP